MQNFKKYTPLLQELVLKDIKIKYRGSVLGLIWSVLNPLLNMVVMTVVFSTMFKNPIPNFPIYFLSGSLIFAYNQEATTEAMTSIIYGAGLLKKVYVPKYIFPLSKVIMALVNMAFSLVAMLLIMLVTGTKFHWTILMMPLLLFYVSLFATGLGLFLCAITVRFRDVRYFYTVLVMAWNFLTPIFYPASYLPEVVLQLQNFNPMFHYVNFSRNIVLYGVAPSIWLHLFCLGFGLLLLVIGTNVFKRMQDSFIYYI